MIASAAHPNSPFDNTHISIADRESILNWLSEFRVDPERALILDEFFVIYDEYRNKLSGQDYGLLVVHEKMKRDFRTVSVNYEDDRTTAIVPEEFSEFDPSDRKFLAAALADPGNISIINASDSDWREVEEEVAGLGIELVQLL
jgi:hypothetical protein